MDKQLIINDIASLSGLIDTLNRAGNKNAIDVVVAKILELIKQL